MHREFDVVVFGASGFTGRRAARYLADTPRPVRWALAGRNRGRLESLGLGVPVIVADAESAADLAALAARTHVALNMAGPFRRFGDPLVRACVERDTHYCDISGETARIRDLIDSYHKTAKAKGVKIVPFGGAGSVPADLAVLLLGERLGGEAERATAYVRLRGGMFNGGTVASMIDAARGPDGKRERDPFLLGPAGRAPLEWERDPRGLSYSAAERSWLTASPLGVSNSRAVRRSGVLRGRDIGYREYMAFDGPFGFVPAIAMRASLGLVGVLLRFGIGRRLLTRLAPPGNGPSEQQVASGYFEIVVRGRAADGAASSVRLCAPGDPANQVTVTCACELAMSLALDGDLLPAGGGVLTPATAVGAVLGKRLASVGAHITTE